MRPVLSETKRQKTNTGKTQTFIKTNTVRFIKLQHIKQQL